MTFASSISARCNATLRDDVKAGIIKPCEPGACVVGSIGGATVTEKDWHKSMEAFGAVVVEFNTSRKALPHPGHVIRVNFCTACGTNVEKFHSERDSFTHEMWSRLMDGVKE